MSPTVQATFGAYYLRDEIMLVPSNSAGGYDQLADTGEFLEASLLTRIDDIRYLGPFPFAETIPPEIFPFFLNSAYDVRRAEVVGRFLAGCERTIGVYGLVGVGDLNYTDQPDEAVVDRDVSKRQDAAVQRVRCRLAGFSALDPSQGAK